MANKQLGKTPEQERRERQAAIDRVKQSLTSSPGKNPPIPGVQPINPVRLREEEKQREMEQAKCGNCGRPGHSSMSCILPKQRP